MTTLREEATALKNRVIQPGEIVIIKADIVQEAFRHDLRFRCHGGFGMNPELTGTALVGTWLIDGEYCRMERYDIDWEATARYRREQQQKEETA